MLRLFGVAGIVVGGFLYFVGSLPANASPCDGECVRPFLMDLAYYGGEILFVAAIIDLVAVTMWQFRQQRRESKTRPK